MKKRFILPVCLVAVVEVRMMDHRVLVVDQFQGFVVDHNMVAEVEVALPIQSEQKRGFSLAFF